MGLFSLRFPSAKNPRFQFQAFEWRLLHSAGAGHNDPGGPFQPLKSMIVAVDANPEAPWRLGEVMFPLINDDFLNKRLFYGFVPTPIHSSAHRLGFATFCIQGQDNKLKLFLSSWLWVINCQVSPWARALEAWELVQQLSQLIQLLQYKRAQKILASSTLHEPLGLQYHPNPDHLPAFRLAKLTASLLTEREMLCFLLRLVIEQGAQIPQIQQKDGVRLSLPT